jgi:hypothetical protein
MRRERERERVEGLKSEPQMAKEEGGPEDIYGVNRRRIRRESVVGEERGKKKRRKRKKKEQ